MGLELKVLDNGDHTCLIWRPADNNPIPGCRGFAVARVLNGAKDYLPNFVGFAPGVAGPQLTNVWPVQRYMWWDYGVKPGDVVQYQVIPMTGPANALQSDTSLASALTDKMTISGQCSNSLTAYFNKGIIAAQWVAKELDEEARGQNRQAALKDIIAKDGDPLRDALAGLLKPAILNALAEDPNATFYAALYELNDPELLDAIKARGARFNLILANGAFKGHSDENAAVRKQLKTQTQVKVYDRLVPSGHFAHNKFVVFCDGQGKPKKVLTGSTNWTSTGLCSQANNALFIDDATVAKAYKDEWDRLHQAGNAYPPSLAQANSVQKTFQVDGGNITVWFAPTQQHEDLHFARQLINNAKQGILFLFFNPGPFQEDPEQWTLLQSILNRHEQDNNPYYDGNLYIRGVVNQEIPNVTTGPMAPPTGRGRGAAPAPPANVHQNDPAAPLNPVALFGGDEPQLGASVSTLRLDTDVLVPNNIKQQFAQWEPELRGASMVMVHSKVIVIDPFGDHPVVMTGSHNLGPKASAKNDDNLAIIDNNPARRRHMRSTLSRSSSSTAGGTSSSRTRANPACFRAWRTTINGRPATLRESRAPSSAFG